MMFEATAQWPQQAANEYSCGAHSQQAFSSAQPPPPGFPVDAGSVPDEVPPPPPDAPPQPPDAAPVAATDAQNAAAWAAYYQQQQQYDAAAHAAQWAAYQQQQQQAGYAVPYGGQPQHWQGYGQPHQQQQAAWTGYAPPKPQPPQQPYPGAAAAAQANGSTAQPLPGATPHAPTSANSTPKAATALNNVPWRSRNAAALPLATTAQSGGPQQYNAVAPPASVINGASNRPSMLQRHAPGIAKAFTIQPQMAKKKATGPAHNAFAPAASPAYTKVEETNSAAAPGGHPPAMRAYVERVFAAGIPPERKTAVQAELKELIQAASAKGDLWTRDWDTMPLPSSLTADGGAAAKQAAEAAAAVLSARVANADNRWDTARRGAAGAAGLAAGPALDAVSRKRVQLPDWRPGGDWKRKPEAKRQKKANKYSRPQSISSDSDDSGTRSTAQRSAYRGPEETARASNRARRFGDGRADGTAGGQPVGRRAGPDRKEQVAAAEEVDFDAFIIKGTCQQLEKSYFRLTSAPDPSVVRPPAVLRRALDRLLRLLRTSAVQYFYAVDQFKGMRQDCTVQHLRDALTVSIYEAAARAALQYGDHAEYNQCQTQLNALHGEGLPGSRVEFLAYRLLYQTVHAASGEAVALAAAMRLAVTQAAQEPAVRHAMQVREAVCTHDWSAFFRLYARAPNMGRALLDMAAPSMRWAALNAMVKTFKPSVAVPFVSRVLGFAPRLAGTSRLASAGQIGSQAGVDQTLGDQSPVRETGLPSGAGLSRAADGTVPSGGVSDNCAAGTASGADDAALEVLPGCSQAVYKGKYQAADDPEEAAETCIDWLKMHGAAVVQTPGETFNAALLDCKASTGKLFIPEDTTAVAHGDQNLAISDFLSKVAV